MESIAHFDVRLWRTLPLLAFRPGTLALRWRSGKRAPYLPPLHVFLLAVFLLFLTPSLTGRHLALPEGDEILTTREAALAGTAGGVRITLQEDTEFQRRAASFIRARLENPEYRSYKAETLAYKLSFLMAPVGMIVLWLLLIGKRAFTFYDHAVVSLHGAGFFAFLATIVLALPPGWTWPAILIVVAIAPVHATAHLRAAYRLSWLGAALRALMLTLLMGAALLIFAFGILLLSLL
jgi:hypothetical protein